MYGIATNLYLEIADRLVDAIGSKEFFSGVVSYTFGDVECRLVCTLIIHRAERAENDASYPRITEIVPVWWEFSTVDGSVQLLNDFSFGELKSYILA